MQIRKKLTIAILSILTPFLLALLLIIFWAVRINHLKNISFIAESSVSQMYKLKYYTTSLLYKGEGKDIVYQKWYDSVVEMRQHNRRLKKISLGNLKKEIKVQINETIKIWELADKDIVMAYELYDWIIKGRYEDYFMLHSLFEAFDSGYFYKDHIMFKQIHSMIKGINSLELYGDSFTDKLLEVHTQIINYSRVQITRILIFLFSFIFLSTVSAVIFVFKFSSNVSNRIYKIKNVVEHVANGEKVLAEEDMVQDEIGDLSRYTKQIMLLMDEKNKNLGTANYELKTMSENLIKTNVKLEESIKTIKETQEQLIISEKMAALGGLVAGVAHEINTPLGICITAITFLKDEIEAVQADQLPGQYINLFSKIVEGSELIYRNLERASDLVKSFKKVSVDQMVEELRTINLKDYISDVMKTLVPVVKKKGHKYNIEGLDNILINTYPGMISQVITNFVMNASIYAFMNKKGAIKIKLQKRKGKVIIEFSDNGIGMEKSVVNRIFEPFYTTGRDRNGTGLGLYLVYNIITQKLKGEIDCKSKLGEGTTFFVELPESLSSQESF